MKYTDTYKTLRAAAEGVYKEKGSKFIAYAFPVTSEEQIKSITQKLKKEHQSARHHCFAWKLGAEIQTFRVNDDGEPSGTAGRPILGQINLLQLTDTLIVVVRYFGGILLGTSGLSNAYKLAAANALENGDIIEKIIESVIVIKFDYLAMNELMIILKEFGLGLMESHFDLACQVKIRVRKDLKTIVLDKLEKSGKFTPVLISDN
jgi:uncharacterized YigZ family protein